jgi:O-antigen ligase
MASAKKGHFITRIPAPRLQQSCTPADFNPVRAFRTGRQTIHAACLLVLLIWPLLAFGGWYWWTALPFIAGVAALTLWVRPVIGEPQNLRTLDRMLLVVLGCAAIQMVPLPAALVARLSPARAARSPMVPAQAPWLDDRLTSLSIDLPASAFAIALTAAAFLVFWSARHVLLQGGLRHLLRGIAWVGLAVSILAILFKATSADTIYGFWQAETAGARPFGPFLNRNHFATWLIMAIPLTVGYLLAHLGTRRPRRRGRAVYNVLVDDESTRGLWLLAAACAMTVTLVLTMSRSGLLAMAGALGAGLWLAGGRLRRTQARVLAIAGLMLVLVGAAWSDPDASWPRWEETPRPNPAGRLVIWRETLPIIRDFWATGTGLGTFGTAMAVYQQADQRVSFNQAHSHYLHAVTEGGVLLAVPLVMAVLGLVGAIARRLRHDRSEVYWIRVGACCGLLAVTIQSIWETGLRMPANAALCAVLAAIALHERFTVSRVGDCTRRS